MDIPFNIDLPPVPHCFSRLLVDESEMSAQPSQPWKEAERLRELKDVMLKSLALESAPDTTLVMEKEMDASDITIVNVPLQETAEENNNEPGECTCEEKQEKLATFATESELDLELTSCGSPISNSSRLNAAITRLKQEMTDLRHLDMSLFCQLLTLNEAIQDFKTSFSDRYSEYTGSEYTCSEYSFGGMGSRVESFSSLSDEDDKGGDFTGGVEDRNNSGQVAEEHGDADEIAASTSSLLLQIKALTQRAEAEF